MWTHYVRYHISHSAQTIQTHTTHTNHSYAASLSFNIAHASSLLERMPNKMTRQNKRAETHKNNNNNNEKSLFEKAKNTRMMENEYDNIPYISYPKARTITKMSKQNKSWIFAGGGGQSRTSIGWPRQRP